MKVKYIKYEKNKEDLTVFRYNSDYNSIYETTKKEIKKNIKIEFISKTIIDKEEYKNLYQDFINYITSNKVIDIIEVAANLKEIFKSLSEEELNIRIQNGNYLQEVRYKNSILDSSLFEIKNLSDLMMVSSSSNGINIQYKKNNEYISDLEGANDIYSKLNIFFEKIFKLRNLEKKELVKTKEME